MKIVIDRSGDGCIRFKGNMSRRIGRYVSGNCWVRCRGNSISPVRRYSSAFLKKCRGISTIGGC